MRILNCFVFLLVNFYLKAQAITCDEIITDPIKYFSEQVKYIDYQSNIDQSSKVCGTDLRTLLTDANNDHFKTLHSDYTFNYHIDRLKAQSIYGPVDKDDLDSARKYSKLFGNYRSTEIEQYFAEGQKKPSIPDNCSPVDLRSKMEPIHHQGDVGWCHAYTAADLFSFKTGKQISAASLAVHGERKFISPVKIIEPESEVSARGSYLDHTLTAGLQKGLCLEKDFPSEYYPDKRQYNQMLDFIKESESRANLINQIKKLKLPISGLDIEIKDCLQETAQSLHSMKQIQTLKKIRDAVIKNSVATDVFLNMEEKACKQRRIFPNVSIQSIGKDRPKTQMITAIDDQLKKGAPAGVAYFADFLNEEMAKESGHASSVIGRNINPQTNKCEYLIRNSWGSSCEGVPEKYRCHKGNFWVTRDELYRNLIQVSYIK